MHRVAMRRAFTLIEVIVALLIFEFGMLALAGAAAVAVRDFGAAKLRSRAKSIALDRVGRLQIVACGAAASGTATHGVIRESWHVESLGGARVITDSVVVPQPEGESAVVTATGTVLCAAEP
jgi:Tfp pilus assembly protein PilV